MVKKKEQKKAAKKPSMSFFTALSLSFNNLLTKKGRTFMTSFAGSIGIIGIALILSLSTGVKKYIDDILTGLESDCFLYVAHPDVMNFTGSDDIYEKHMVRLLDELKRRNMPIEINANGYVDRVHYPSERLVKLGVKNGNI